MSGRMAIVLVGLLAMSSQTLWAEDDRGGQIDAQATTSETADQLREAIESARTSDPELASALEGQLAQLQLPRPNGQLFAKAQSFSGPSDPAMEEVNEDPRMAELRQLYEAGTLSEEEVQTRLFSILSDHGIASPEGEQPDELPAGVTRDMVDQLLAPQTLAKPAELEPVGLHDLEPTQESTPTDAPQDQQAVGGGPDAASAQ